MHGVDMCNSRRLFGDLAEWTWGSAGAKWRAFGDVSEWTWGSGLVWRTFGAEWAASGRPHGERVARFPKNAHISGQLADDDKADSPKTLTLAVVEFP